ncbi:hypothetical protein [Lysobacter firmicutimachus]|uniref:Uncharacterized protein n=1 Tax=Lysobacter firmicutimachus TaxID=1792846 RepID=A0ABU8D6H3_9GAMM
MRGSFFSIALKAKPGAGFSALDEIAPKIFASTHRIRRALRRRVRRSSEEEKIPSARPVRFRVAQADLRETARTFFLPLGTGSFALVRIGRATRACASERAPVDAGARAADPARGGRIPAHRGRTGGNEKIPGKNVFSSCAGADRANPTGMRCGAVDEGRAARSPRRSEDAPRRSP